MSKKISSVVFGAALALALGLTGCVQAPFVFHEGLSAQVPKPGKIEARGGLNAMQVFGPSEGEMSTATNFNVGVRTAQHFGPFVAEEGLDALVTVGQLMGFHAGIGLFSPAIMLRGSVYPIASFGDLSTFGVDMVWWQSSLMFGNPRRGYGPEFSAGAAASNYGIGPIVSGGFCLSGLRLTGQASYTQRASWAPEDIGGRVVSFGITGSYYPAISLPELPKRDSE